MATKKRDINKAAVITGKVLEKLANGAEKTIEIIEAVMKDGFCNYKYIIINGNQKGFVHSVTGKGIIEDDMRTSFSKLGVHLAVIDDMFKHSKVQIGNIDKMHTDELTLLYEVTGFKIKGGEENESIILIGTKILSTGGRMELETPKTPLDNLSSYAWYNELKTAADECRKEVVLYHEGKYTPVKEDDDKENEAQLKADFSNKQDETEEDFENAKV